MSKKRLIESVLGKEVAVGLWDIGAIMDKTKSPEGEGFRLKLHETDSDAPLSPIYVNLRTIRSYPKLMASVVGLYRTMLSDFRFDRLADIPVASSPIVAILMMKMSIPMITPREPKDRGAKASVLGAFKTGLQHAVALIDDLITKAHSKIEAAKILRAAGLIVEHVFVLVDREQGGRAQLEEEGMELHDVFTLMELLEFYLSENLMSQEMHDEVVAYLSGS